MRRISTVSPSALYPDLYRQFALAERGPDMKLLADAVPRRRPDEIMEDYRRDRPNSPEEVRAFVDERFDLPRVPPPQDQGHQSLALADHINDLWRTLVRYDEGLRPGESRIRLPHRYLVPGGIFRESYYWDTYFTIIGLRFHDADLCAESVRNLAYLIDEFGFIPNGNRTYYLTRSQPPVFFAAIAALDEAHSGRAFAYYLPQLRSEHAFWMAGESDATRDQARRVVRMPGGEILNRYWDDGDWPRDEALRADLALASTARDRPDEVLFRNVRAACESGWDFSSRWFADFQSMDTIMTTSIVPSDLNALLFGLETAIRLGAEETGDSSLAAEFARRAAARSQAMNRYLWNEPDGFFDDYDLTTNRLRNAVTPACLFALFCGLASPAQAERTSDFVEHRLIAPGGLSTSLNATGQQWDWPNGWAPLQWIAVQGLERYGFEQLARKIAQRWLATVHRVFEATGCLFEKYDVANQDRGGGGEYPLQDGFGWTNGVTLALLHKYPEANCDR